MADDEKTTKKDPEEALQPKEAVEDTTPATEAVPEAQGPQTRKPKKQTAKWLKRFLASKKGRIVLAITALVVAIGVLFAIPVTRYALAGTVLKKDVTITLQDEMTNKPISDVQLTLANQTVKTSADGKAAFRHIPVGEYRIGATKKYYKDAAEDLTVPILTAPRALLLSLEATGRQVPVKVINKITGKPLQKATVAAAGTSATTDANGEAIIVLPADKQTIAGTVNASGYNNLKVSLQVTEQKDDKNTFGATPSGTIFFLSKRTGTINVMKSDLDGGNAEVVVQGTGKEEEGGTVLLASRDWRYLALQARRDSDKPKLYLIDTSNAKLTTIDEGNVTFTPVGWYGHTFTFKVDRGLSYWLPKQQALKTFNADNNKLAIADETAAAGNQGDSAAEQFGTILILDNLLVYTKNWYGSQDQMGGQHTSIFSMRLDTSEKKTIKQVDAGNNYISQLVPYKPQEFYFRLTENGHDTFWEYNDGQTSQTNDINDSILTQAYPTFLLSPSGKKTLWVESRDGRNHVFVGNASGDQAKDLGNLEDYTSYGWYGDDYILLSKKGSELYVAAADLQLTDGSLLKVTDYHKPNVMFFGYGYGYGGF